MRQRTKFKYVVSQLHQQHAAEVEDIITSPAHDPNDWLKQHWCADCPPHANSAWDNSICTRKLATVHQRISSGTWHDLPDSFLRTLRANRLLTHVQAILAGQTEGSLDNRSSSTGPDSALHIADKVCEVTQLSFGAREHIRATGACRGSLTPSGVTAAVTNSQPLTLHTHTHTHTHALGPVNWELYSSRPD